MLLLGCHTQQVSRVGLSPHGPASQGIRTSVDGRLRISCPYRVYGNLRECIQMRCSIRIAQAAILVFVLSALSWVYVEEVSICLFCATKISWGGGMRASKRTDGGGGVGQWQAGPTRTLHFTPQPPAGLTPVLFSLSLHYPSIFSFSVWLSDHAQQWGPSLDSCTGTWWHCLEPGPLSGRWRGPLRQRWNCLPALSALKCSLTPSSRPWEVHSATACSPSHSVRCTSWRGEKKISTYSSDVFVWFHPASVSDCRLVCCANISYSACGSFSMCEKLMTCLRRSLRPRTRREVHVTWSRGTALFIET